MNSALTVTLFAILIVPGMIGGALLGWLLGLGSFQATLWLVYFIASHVA